LKRRKRKSDIPRKETAPEHRFTSLIFEQKHTYSVSGVILKRRERELNNLKEERAPEHGS
jgi:hypothetical protein